MKYSGSGVSMKVIVSRTCKHRPSLAQKVTGPAEGYHLIAISSLVLSKSEGNLLDWVYVAF